ncbi:preQ(1) synthase [Synechococcus sp. PCC 7336]|uniref:preQ(1) synthase n=1 Tax=Synechococcus sp. PCC 7336 TaxID=195250 RepID=UPI000372A6F1|nr:preQ(1) synthase [Synechococcus sp. PCC 7336]
MTASSATPAEVTPNAPEPKYGEEAIAGNQFVTFPNPREGRDYTVHITLPEFTCKCPFSGYPDFATFTLTYTPGPSVVELKSLKLYINSYRDVYIAHEAATNQILDDIVAACQPVRARLTGDFNPRGNVHTVVEVSYERPDSDS